MTTALVTCTTCGDLKVKTADLTVHTWASEGREDFSFRCPICSMTTVTPASTTTIDLLLACDTTAQTWDTALKRDTSPLPETARPTV